MAVNRGWETAANVSTLVAALNIVEGVVFLLLGDWRQAGIQLIGFIGATWGANVFYQFAEKP